MLDAGGAAIGVGVRSCFTPAHWSWEMTVVLTPSVCSVAQRQLVGPGVVRTDQFVGVAVGVPGMLRARDSGW